VVRVAEKRIEDMSKTVLRSTETRSTAEVGGMTVTPNEKWYEDTALWQLKVRMQFSGWLQYVVHGVWAVIAWALVGIGWLIGYSPLLLFWLPLAIAVFLTISLFGTILIVKYGLHPAERIPASKAHLDVFDIVKDRRSCRSFQSRNLTPEHHQEIMKSVGRHSQPVRQLGGHPVRFEYIAAPLTVWPVVGGHEFLVAIAPKEYNRITIVDVGRSLQKVVIDATRMGLATCWIGPGADQGSIISHLGDKFDPSRDHVICVCAVGYESIYKPFFIRLIQRVQHKRMPLDELFFDGPTFGRSLDTTSKPFSDYGRCYEVCQWSPSSYNGQTTRAVAVTDDTGENLVRTDFYSSTNSRFYAMVALGIWLANWEIGCEELGRSGYFSELSADERCVENSAEPPRYIASWLPDGNRLGTPNSSSMMQTSS
jgi:nitroreductase